MADVRSVKLARLKWLHRQSKRKEMPASYFLIPSERKFPVRNPDGTYNCNLIRAAITRAAQHGYREVEAKARRLYQRICKKEK